MRRRIDLPQPPSPSKRGDTLDILAFVLAGGEGQRLRPLTLDQPKPAIELGHGHRIVDFAIGNLVNSGVRRICVIAQYKPERLVTHLERTWQPWLARGGCTLDVRLPDDRQGRFTGTATAVHRNVDAMARDRPDIVAVFAADHVYRMDIRQMADFHLERHADVTVAAVPVPIEDARHFGVIEADASGRIVAFEEKPVQPRAMPGDAGHAYASMGNYLFDPQALVALLHGSVAAGGTDFGHHVLPRALAVGSALFAYDFARNRVPGTRRYEQRSYWRDVGTLNALAQARQETLGPTPRFDLRNPAWPLKPPLDAQGNAAE